LDGFSKYASELLIVSALANLDGPIVASLSASHVIDDGANEFASASVKSAAAVAANIPDHRSRGH
jgi:hypothetical protein